MGQKHNYVGTQVYNAYYNMMGRCYNKKNTGYHNYGGRGIKVCTEWKNSFLVFLEDLGVPPSNKHSLDRIDNNGDYSPENCRWATRLEQSRNTRRNRLLTFNGKTLTQKEWAQRIGIEEAALKTRIKRGWTVEQILTPPKPERYRQPTTKFVVYRGEKKTIREWAEIVGIPKGLMKYRLKHWTIHEAMTLNYRPKPR